ncbi:MAG: hypothetical protein ABI778_08090 [Ignavibacteriota bacterium]
MQTATLPEPLKAKRGEQYDEVFAFYDEDDNPVDVSAWIPSLELRERKDSSAAAATATCTVQNTNEVRVVISSAATNLLKAREYETDLRCEISGEVQYPFEGKFVIEEAITRA